MSLTLELDQLNRDSIDSTSLSPNHACEIHSLMCSFLKEHTAYDVLPVSYRLIVFDSQLLMKKALDMLAQNGIYT